MSSPDGSATTKVSVEYFVMSNPAEPTAELGRIQLEEKLREADQRLRHEMLARGFDPDQEDNVALTTPLARLYLERESLRDQLETLSDQHDLKVEGISMMNEVQRITDQLKRAFAGEAWHGPAVLQVLEGITAAQAAARPANSAHSIWEIAFHIAAWEGAVRKRLRGERGELSAAEDWPAVTDASEQGWERAKGLLREVHQDLCDAVSELDEARLDQPIVAGMSSVYVTLHGVIQHSLYHAGQIALLKKLSTEVERI